MNKILIIIVILFSSFIYAAKELTNSSIITLKIFIDQQLENEVRRSSNLPSYIPLTRNNFIYHVATYQHPEILCNLKTVIRFYATFRGTAFEVYKKPLVERKS